MICQINLILVAFNLRWNYQKISALLPIVLGIETTVFDV